MGRAQSWSVRDAKARFSELLETCLSEGPQLVTKRGKAAAMLVPIRQWNALQTAGKRTLKQILLGAAAGSKDSIGPASPK